MSFTTMHCIFKLAALMTAGNANFRCAVLSEISSPKVLSLFQKLDFFKNNFAAIIFCSKCLCGVAGTSHYSYVQI